MEYVLLLIDDIVEVLSRLLSKKDDDDEYLDEASDDVGEVERSKSRPIV